MVAGTARADQRDAGPSAAGRPVAVPPSPSDGAAEIVSRVEECYEKVRTLEAGFRQITGYDGTKAPAGSVIFEQPGKMSWRYRSGDRIVSDGTRVKSYASESKQLFEQDLAKSVYPIALSFLAGKAELDRSFQFTKFDSISPRFEGRHVLIGEPRRPSPICQRLVYYVDAKTYQVHRVQIAGTQGYRIRFDFVGSKLNRRVPQGEFDFSAPGGTQIIRL